METFQALEVVLGLLVPITWILLELRWTSCEASGTLAHETLNQEQILVLNTLCPKKPLTPESTARDALFAVAELGGHIKNNGDPGWIVIGRIRNAHSSHLGG